MGQPGEPFRRRFDLPWPPAVLGPNGGHGHWHTQHRAKKAYWDACYVATCASRRSPWIGVPKTGRLALRMTFHPPRRYRYDEDNLVARMKSGLDAVARAMQIDDVRFKLAGVVIGDTNQFGKVVIEIEAIQ